MIAEVKEVVYYMPMISWEAVLGVLSVLVTILIGWNIYSVVNIREFKKDTLHSIDNKINEVERDVDDKIKQVSKAVDIKASLHVCEVFVHTLTVQAQAYREVKNHIMAFCNYMFALEHCSKIYDKDENARENTINILSAARDVAIIIEKETKNTLNLGGYERHRDRWFRALCKIAIGINNEHIKYLIQLLTQPSNKVDN